MAVTAPALFCALVPFGRDTFGFGKGIASYYYCSALIKEQPWEENLLIYLLFALCSQTLPVAPGIAIKRT